MALKGAPVAREDSSNAKIATKIVKYLIKTLF
jgi:hypothetical protein